MAHLKKAHPALCGGGMKFLYAQGDTFAIARFTGEEAIVGVISKSDTQETIRLPLGALGAQAPKEDRDFFGSALRWQRTENAVLLQIEPHGSYLFACEM